MLYFREVKGYLPADAETLAALHDRNFTNAASQEDQRAIADLQDKKQELANELRSLEKTMKLAKTSDVSAAAGALLSNTSLTFNLIPDINAAQLSMRVEANPNDAMIVNVIAIDSEGLFFEGCEVLAVTPSSTGKPAVLPFKPIKFNACVLRVQTHLAARGMNSQLHVFEKEVRDFNLEFHHNNLFIDQYSQVCSVSTNT